MQRNVRDRIEVLTFFRAVRDAQGPASMKQMHKKLKGSYSNKIEMFWKVMSLGKRMYWFQHVSSFISEDLSVSRK